MFTFARSMWYDPQEQRRCARVRRTFCNVTMLGQMLPKTPCKNPVSESGNVVTTFSMSRGDVGLTLHQPHPFGADHCFFASRRLCVCKALYFPIALQRLLCVVLSRRASKSLTTWAPAIAQQTQDVKACHELGCPVERKICFFNPWFCRV